MVVALFVSIVVGFEWVAGVILLVMVVVDSAAEVVVVVASMSMSVVVAVAAEMVVGTRKTIGVLLVEIVVERSWGVGVETDFEVE